MSPKYTIVNDQCGPWICFPNNGGELGPSTLDIVQELNRLQRDRDKAQQENKLLKERIKRLEEIAEELVEESDIYNRRGIWRKAKETNP